MSAEKVDVTDYNKLVSTISGADVVINATNYYYNLDVMKGVLKAGVDYVDLGGLYHITKKQLRLHSAFKKKGITAILGCGSTPGITNVLVAHATELLDRVDSVHIQFADKDYTTYDMPIVVPYSMRTVFDEFSKRPVILENRKLRYVEPMSGEIVVKFPKPINNVSCFYSLHSELATIPAWLSRKGIKSCSFRVGFDADFVSKVKFLIEAGFADDGPIRGFPHSVSPRDMSVALLNRFMPYDAKVNDMELLRVEARGSSKGRKRTVVAYCKAVSNKRYNIPAGSWDTGVPPSIVAQMLIKGNIKPTGVMAPESCIDPALFFAELKKRNMSVYIT